MPQLGIFCHQRKLTMLGIRYILLTHWQKGSHKSLFPNITGFYHGYWLFSIIYVEEEASRLLESDNKTLLMKTQLPYVIGPVEKKIKLITN